MRTIKNADNRPIMFLGRCSVFRVVQVFYTLEGMIYGQRTKRHRYYIIGSYCSENEQ